MTSTKTVRKAVVWQLTPGKKEPYEIAHRQIPSALAAEIRASGIRNYSIYLHPETDQVFAYLEIDEAAANLYADGPEEKRWWEEQMSKLFAQTPDGTAIEFPLREVFHQD